MNWHRYELDEVIMKTTESAKLWESEIGFVELDKDSLAVPLNVGDRRAGYVFEGSGRLVMDAIVETERGAVGESIERELKSMFINLSDPEPVQIHLTEADNEDLSRKGYGSKDELVSKAQTVLNENLNKGTRHSGCCSNHHLGQMFIFPNQNGEADVLLAKGSRTIYHTSETTFVSSNRETVLTNPKEVVVSHHGKAFSFRR